MQNPAIKFNKKEVLLVTIIKLCKAVIPSQDQIHWNK